MDIFNKKRIKSLEDKIHELRGCIEEKNSQILSLINPVKQKEDFQKTHGIIDHRIPKHTEFKVSETEKIKYEIDFPRIYNLGKKYDYGICINVEVLTEKDWCHDTIGFDTSSTEKIIGRKYIFKNDKITSELIEALKTK